jgi:hypothetical protein
VLVLVLLVRAFCDPACEGNSNPNVGFIACAADSAVARSSPQIANKCMHANM